MIKLFWGADLQTIPPLSSSLGVGVRHALSHPFCVLMTVVITRVDDPSLLLNTDNPWSCPHFSTSCGTAHMPRPISQADHEVKEEESLFEFFRVARGSFDGKHPVLGYGGTRKNSCNSPLNYQCQWKLLHQPTIGLVWRVNGTAKHVQRTEAIPR